jgi:hypothetical protein
MTSFGAHRAPLQYFCPCSIKSFCQDSITTKSQQTLLIDFLLANDERLSNLEKLVSRLIEQEPSVDGPGGIISLQDDLNKLLELSRDAQAKRERLSRVFGQI